MLSCRLIACAEDALRDADNNQLSMIRLVEAISASSWPLLIPRLCLCVLFDRSPEDPPRFTCIVHWSLGAVDLFRREIVLDFGSALRHRALVHLRDLVLPGEGLLQVTVVHQRSELASFPIPVSSAVQ